MNRRHTGTASVIIFLSLLFLLQAVTVTGQEMVTEPGAGTGSDDLSLRVMQDKRNAQIWWYGWLAGYSGATAGQAIVSLTTEDMTLRQDMALGAATTLLGALGQVIAPMYPRDEFRDFPSYKQYISGGRPLSAEESAMLLKALADREKEGRSWKTHAIAGVVNLSSGLITWLGFKRTVWDGVANFALNTAVTEAQIWTQPTRAIKDYERYLRENNPEAGMIPSKPEREWTVSVYPGGVALRCDF
jgi:hypothetical protein